MTKRMTKRTAAEVKVVYEMSRDSLLAGDSHTPPYDHVDAVLSARTNTYQTFLGRGFDVDDIATAMGWEEP